MSWKVYHTLFLKDIHIGAGELAQWLRTVTVSAEEGPEFGSQHPYQAA